jgi:hypothetical protein
MKHKKKITNSFSHVTTFLLGVFGMILMYGSIWIKFLDILGIIIFSLGICYSAYYDSKLDIERSR